MVKFQLKTLSLFLPSLSLILLPNLATGSKPESTAPKPEFDPLYNLELRLKYDNTPALIKFKTADNKGFEIPNSQNYRVTMTTEYSQGVPVTVKKEDGILSYDFQEKEDSAVLISILGPGKAPIEWEETVLKDLPLNLKGNQDLVIQAELAPYRQVYYVDVWGGKSLAENDLKKRWKLSNGPRGSHSLFFRRGNLMGPELMKPEAFVNYVMKDGPGKAEKAEAPHIKFKDPKGNKRTVPLKGIKKIIIEGEGGPPSNPPIPFRFSIAQTVDENNHWSWVSIIPANIWQNVAGGRRFKEKHQIKSIKLVGSGLAKDQVYPVHKKGLVTLVSSDELKLSIFPEGKDGEPYPMLGDTKRTYTLPSNQLIIKTSGKDSDSKESTTEAAVETKMPPKATKGGCALIRH